jgi:hypothetical protein
MGVFAGGVFSFIHGRSMSPAPIAMPWCMHRDISFCCCPLLDYIVFGLDATYYPKCKLLRVENQLFCMRSAHIGRHALQMLVHAANSSFFYARHVQVYSRMFSGSSTQ